MSGEKKDSDPTEDLETTAKPASGARPARDEAGGSDAGVRSGIYLPSDDTVPSREIPVTFQDTGEDIPVKGEPRKDDGELKDSDEESCAEEGGVPHDILALYGARDSGEKEPGDDGYEADEREEEIPTVTDSEEEPASVHLEAPEALVRRVTRRFSAKLIDFLIAAVLYQVPGIVGPAAAVAYICLADGISGGSPGKRLAGGLRVVSTLRDGVPCDFRDSILRNSIFGLLVAAFFLLGWIPYFGKLAVFVLGLAVVAYEASLLYKVSGSTRIGDTLAGTRVIEPEQAEGFEPGDTTEPPESSQPQTSR